ncbi:MAG TPA: hypothetical protein PKM88_13430 [bacterium]|nr:hypothetical protein [bacterium]
MALDDVLARVSDARHAVTLACGMHVVRLLLPARAQCRQLSVLSPL